MAIYYRNNSFPNRLRTFLKEKRVKNKDLAQELGVSVSTIGYWLSGKREPSEEHMDALCDFFGVNYLEFTHTPDELSEGNLRFLFVKFRLDPNDFERFEEFEKLIGDYFIDNVGKFRKKSNY